MTKDELNTWRALKDQVPVVTSKLCFFGIHTWTKWGEPFRYGYNYYQLKECIHCNSKRNKQINEITAAGAKVS